jgi:hypothetical protein
VPAGPGNGASSAGLEITLFGPACSHYAWVLGALDRACRQGLGKARVTWEVQRVLRLRPGGERESLAGGDLSALPAILPPDALSLSLNAEAAAHGIEVTFLSPTRLLRDGRFLPDREPVPFDLLVARILDRFAGLYGREASELLGTEARAALESEAARVPILRHDTRWVEVRDYSARSRSEMLLGGKVGRIAYGEGAVRFLPILRAGEILQVGKNAASGCGRIEVGPEREPSGPVLALAQTAVPGPRSAEPAR